MSISALDRELEMRAAEREAVCDDMADEDEDDDDDEQHRARFEDEGAFQRCGEGRDALFQRGLFGRGEESDGVVVRRSRRRGGNDDGWKRRLLRHEGKRQVCAWGIS